MNATVKKVLTAMDLSFDREPVDVRDVPLPQGRTWKQYLYQLPDNRLAAVLVTEQAGTAYVLLVRCREADAPALTPIFNDLLASYQITAPGANR